MEEFEKKEVRGESGWEDVAPEGESWEEHVAKAEAFLREAGMRRYNKAERRKSERAQEMIEKDLNARLTKIEDLEILAGVDGSGVEKTTTNYFDNEITVYNMKGAELKMLTHSISYKDAATKRMEDAAGSGMMGRLEVMPSLWLDDERRTNEENEAIRKWENHTGMLRGNTISASYTDVRKNPDKRLGTDADRRLSRRKEPYIVYGWDHVEAGSILRAGDGDLRTPQNVGEDYLYVSEGSLGVWDDLENSTGGTYNEVAMKRFTEDGKAKPPDYLVTENGQISELIKAHAATFGAPIVNVERGYYDKK